MANGVIHKRRPPMKAVCGRALALGDASTDYWGGVTCDRCLALKPADAQERTSIKRSHRAEGENFID